MVIKAIFIAWQGIVFLSWISFSGGCNDANRTVQQMPLSTMNSPRAVVSYLQHAMEWRDYRKVVEVVAPPDRPRYSRYFQVLEGEYEDWEKLAAAIRRRFGWGTVLEKAVLEATALSPLLRQTKNGVIDWEALRFTQAEGDSNRMIVRDLGGHYLVELVQLEAKWYIKDFNGGACAMEYMDTLARQAGSFRALIVDLIKAIQEEPPAEVERRVYEAVGQSGPKAAAEDHPKGTSSGPTSKRNPDPLLDD